MIKFSSFKLSTPQSTFLIAIILTALTNPMPVNAGFFSLLESLFENDNAIAIEEREINSQNMAILHASSHIDPNPANGGGDITIIGGSALLPDDGPSGTIADIDGNTSPRSGDHISLYVVRDGDSLSQIAKMFGVTTNTIIWANDIKERSLIREGQQLVILPISGVRHSVEKGETLSGIAKKYKGNLEEILEFNGLSSDATLAVGDVIVVPDGEVATPVYKGASNIVRGGNSPSYSGYYIRPLNGGVRSQGLHGYNAVDLAAPAGTPIFAAASGTVIISKDYGWNGGYGRYVVIKHDNGTQTLYAHTSSNIVSVGKYVVQGQVVGYVGSTGKSTGNHLHFEIRGAKNPF